MAKTVISEYREGDLRAEVLKHSNGTGFTVKQYQGDTVINQEVFAQENRAEDAAEDWVIQNRDDSTIEVPDA